MTTEQRGDRGRRRRQFPNQLSLAVGTAAATLVSVALAFFGGPDEASPRLPTTGPTPVEQLEQEIDSLERELAIVRQQTESLAIVPEEAPVAAQLARLDQTLSAIDERLTGLEEAILTDPAKALQVPLLSNQVADLEERTEAAIAAQRENVDRVYDILKFSIVALAGGVLSMAIATVFRARRGDS